jgi:DNA-binding beta-propeller fold protein YncE
MTRVFALLAAGAACAVGLEASAGTPLWRVGLRPFAHGGSVNALAPSPDGTRVFTSAADGTLRAWTAAGESVWQHRAPDQIRDLAVLPDGALVQVRGDRLVFGDARTGLPTRQIEHRGARAPLATSADGTRLAFRLRYANAVAVTDPRGTELWRAVMPAPGHVAAIALSPDGARLAVAARTAVHVYGAGGARLHTLAHEAPVTDVVFVDAERVATAWNRRALAIWDARTGAREREVPLRSEAQTLAGHVSKKLVVAARFRGLTVWDGARTLEVESPTPRALAFSPDGARLWIATEEQSVRGFDTTTWRALDGRAWPFSIPSTLALDDARGEALVGTYGGHVLRYALKDGAAIEPSARLSKAGGWRPGIRALAALGWRGVVAAPGRRRPHARCSRRPRRGACLRWAARALPRDAARPHRRA